MNDDSKFLIGVLAALAVLCAMTLNECSNQRSRDGQENALKLECFRSGRPALDCNQIGQQGRH
jgi:hypothetical protein